MERSEAATIDARRRRLVLIRRLKGRMSKLREFIVDQGFDGDSAAEMMAVLEAANGKLDVLIREESGR